MQVPFEQILTIVKTLTPTEKALLREELDERGNEQKDKDDFIKLLLNGPVYTEGEIKVIKDNRKSIDKWRTKS